ncbi:MAG: hypothetical protein AAGI08_04285 [Bacteroidota bacterium]
MILRRITQHVKDQNWTAIAIDFVIVVLGVFLGIQLGNWNESRAEAAREGRLLAELRIELAESVEQVAIKRRAFNQVGLSGARSVAFLDMGAECGEDCWPRLVDFLHASQWQQYIVARSTYDEMRRNGWPRSREVLSAMEDYLRQYDQIATALERPPRYRSLVRGLIPLAAHEPYWTGCFELSDGEETYLADCPAGVPPEVASAAVSAIRDHAEVHPALTEWAGFSAGMHIGFDGLIATTERAIAVIDAEISGSP